MKSAPDLGTILKARPDYWPPGQQYDTLDLKIVSPMQLIDVVTILQANGWNDDELKGFLGENMRRVVQQIWH